MEIQKYLKFVEAVYRYSLDNPLPEVIRLLSREIGLDRDKASHVIAAILLFQDHFKTFYYAFLKDPSKAWKHERRRMLADKDGFKEALQAVQEELSDLRVQPSKLAELQFTGYIMQMPSGQYRLGDERKARASTTVNSLNFRVQDIKRRKRAQEKVRAALEDLDADDSLPVRMPTGKRVRWAM